MALPLISYKYTKASCYRLFEITCSLINSQLTYVPCVVHLSYNTFFLTSSTCAKSVKIVMTRSS